MGTVGLREGTWAAVFRVAASLSILLAATPEALAAALPHPFDLSTLDGTNGVRLDGIDAGDYSGYSVSGAGDVNGDGYADLLIGAYMADPGGDVNAGETYLVYGSSSGIPHSSGALDLSTLNGTNGVRLDGIDAGDHSGWSVSGAGDINGDGYADLLIGAYGGDPAGETYLVYGSATGIPHPNGALDLSMLDGTTGVRLDAGGDEASGYSVSGAGDVNGDGYADLLIGAPWADPGGDPSAGETYLVYGSASGIPHSGGALDLSTLNGTNGARLDGIDAADVSGGSVSGAGDVNGDGYADLLIGAHQADSSAGETYLVYGSSSGIPHSGGALDLSTLDGTNGVRLDGIDASDQSGFAVSGAGDVNGDGYADLLIGAYTALPGGETYLVYGSASEIPHSSGALDLSTLNGTNGVRLDGDWGWTGYSVSGAGEVNGDGYADLLIGHFFVDAGSGAGETFLVYGSPSGIPHSGGALDLSTLNGTNGARLDGIDTDDWSAYSVSGAGDVNGDGYADLLIGAHGGDPRGDADAGETYLVYGAGTAGSATHQARSRAGNPPRQGVGMIGDGSHSIPFSRVWVDYAAGDNGAGGPSLTTVVFHRVPTSSFAPLVVEPQYEWEVSTDRVGYGAAAVTFTGAGTAGETGWKGLILKSADGGATWYAPSDQVRNPVLHEITLPNETFPGRYALVVPEDDTAPQVADAVYNDDDNDGAVEAGESVTLVMDQGVVVRPAQLSSASFHLPVAGDSLGGAGFTVSGNALNSRNIDITLGAGASLTVAGDFNPLNTGAGQPSGIDIASGLPPTAIQSLAGVPAQAGSGVDILYTLVANSATIGASGGSVQVTNSPNAAYTNHKLIVPAGALPGDTLLTLQPPPRNQGVLNAVQVDAGGGSVDFLTTVTLTLQYRDSDVDAEMGQVEESMKIHQLYKTGPASYEWRPLAGDPAVDAEANTVSIGILSLNPLHSSGDHGVFANIPGPTIETITHYVAPSVLPVKAVLRFTAPGVWPALRGGSKSIYSHCLEIPGYELTAADDPRRIAVTLSQATLFDRLSQGGVSWPDQSNALFVIQTANAAGAPVAFSDPVDLTVQFFDGTENDLNDCVDLLSSPVPAGRLRLAHDALDGWAVNFRTATGIAMEVTTQRGGGFVHGTGITNLTGASGKGVWGAVAPGPTRSAGQWDKYR